MLEFKKVIPLLAIAAAAAGLLLPASRLCAQATTPGLQRAPQYDGPIYFMPKGADTQLSLEKRRYTFDGLDAWETLLVSNDMTIKLHSVDGWVVNTQPGASIGFAFRQMPAVRMQISFFDKSKRQFIPDTSVKSMKGYAEGLKKLHGAKLNLLNEDRGFRPLAVPDSTGGLPFNKSISAVEYRIGDPKREALGSRHTDYFVDANEKYIMAVRFTAPMDKYDTFKAEAERFFRHVYFVDSEG